MANFWVDMALSVVFAVLKSVIKNAESKEEMKKAFLKLYRQIQVAYADDPDFQ